ncbi:hypothetical protein CEXT_26921 [Caerostris extrusa]|uniref:Uncharacterized protein n=1 Tax=Caerostris extrusa TaxID=172846 RepID=A0AAV4W1D1_CAEEX|nr:hypothetical protein CEXT_26921 [Caerostris extrusa]
MVASKNELEFEDVLAEVGDYGSFQKRMLMFFLAPVASALQLEFDMRRQSLLNLVLTLTNSGGAIGTFIYGALGRQVKAIPKLNF